jgi:putative membrane protein insertion efficiency factor
MRILQNSLLAFVKAYRYTLAPLFMSLGVQCRFTPSCSEYAIQALREHGAVRGAGLAAYRVARCNPFCTGGHDPVPRSFSEISHG